MQWRPLETLLAQTASLDLKSRTQTVWSAHAGSIWVQNCTDTPSQRSTPDSQVLRPFSAFLVQKMLPRTVWIALKKLPDARPSAWCVPGFRFNCRRLQRLPQTHCSNQPPSPQWWIHSPYCSIMSITTLFPWVCWEGGNATCQNHPTSHTEP